MGEVGVGDVAVGGIDGHRLELVLAGRPGRRHRVQHHIGRREVPVAEDGGVQQDLGVEGW